MCMCDVLSFITATQQREKKTFLVFFFFFLAGQDCGAVCGAEWAFMQDQRGLPRLLWWF